MANAAASFKQKAHELIEPLPEAAGWKDLAQEISVMQDIEEGLADSEAGRVTENAEVRRLFSLSEQP